MYDEYEKITKHASAHKGRCTSYDSVTGYNTEHARKAGKYAAAGASACSDCPAGRVISAPSSAAQPVGALCCSVPLLPL